MNTCLLSIELHIDISFLTLQQQTKVTVTSDNADTGSEIVIAGYQVVVSI
jgi:hypothetical protein